MKDVEFCWNCHDEFVFMAWPNSLLRSVSAIGALWILLHAVQMWVAHNNKTIIESTQYVQLRDLLWMVTILLREFSIVCAKYTKINWRQIAICMSALILKWEQQEISPDPYLFTVFTDGWWVFLSCIAVHDLTKNTFHSTSSPVMVSECPERVTILIRLK